MYYCRIYGVANFPNILGVLLAMDDPRIDPLNPPCLRNGTRKLVRVLFFPFDERSLMK